MMHNIEDITTYWEVSGPLSEYIVAKDVLVAPAGIPAERTMTPKINLSAINEFKIINTRLGITIRRTKQKR